MKKGKIMLLFLIRVPISLLLVVAIAFSVRLHISRQPYRDSLKLIKAIKNEDIAEIKQMLESGVDPNVLTLADYEIRFWNALEYGAERPLEVACYVADLEIVKMLIEHGATAEAVDRSDWSPLTQTLYYYQPDDVEMVKLLLENGADPDFEEPDLPVFRAAKMRPKVFDKNKTNGTVFSSDYDIDTAKGITEIVIILLDDKSINIKTSSGRTLLMYAAESGNIYLVDYLIANGSDVSIKDNRGKTAYDYAKQENNAEILALLKQTGDGYVSFTTIIDRVIMILEE